MRETWKSGRRLWRPDVLLAVVALATGLGGAWLARQYLQSRAAAIETSLAQRYASYRVVVAGEDLPRGTVLEAGRLAAREVPREFLPAGAVAADRAGELLGSQAAIDIPRGMPILPGALLDDRARESLSAVLQGDQRAVTIAVDELGSQAGGLRSGDQVDLYYSQRDGGESLLIPLLQQVPVLAAGGVRQQLSGSGEEPHHFGSITLQMAAAEVPRVLLAQQAGQILTVLRAPGDAGRALVQLRRSAELVRTSSGARNAAATRIELLVGGAGELTPTRSWLFPAREAARGDAS